MWHDMVNPGTLPTSATTIIISESARSVHSASSVLRPHDTGVDTSRTMGARKEESGRGVVNVVDALTGGLRANADAFRTPKPPAYITRAVTSRLECFVHIKPR